MRIHSGSKIYVWLFAVAAVSLAAFTGGLFLWASQIDQSTKHREQFLVGEGIKARVSEVASIVTPQVNWDVAVANLDNRFDPAWARSHLTAYLEHNGGFETVVLLNHADQPIYASAQAKVLDPGSYSRFRIAATPLVLQVRAHEARRGRFAGPGAGPGGAPRVLSQPIQASNFDVVDGRAYLITASLVQPDFGASRPALDRAPVVLTMLPIDEAFAAKLASRFKLERISAYVGQPARTVEAVRKGDAVLRLATSESGAPLTFVWEPQKPGAKMALSSLPFIGLVLTLILGAGVVVVWRSERVARRLDATEADARSNAERLNLALQSTRAGVFEVDYVNRTFWCSPEFVELVGRALTFEEATGEVWPVLHPDDVAHVRAFLANRARSGVALVEFRASLPSGEARWLQSRADMTVDAAGRPHKLFGIVLDVDARKCQELALMEAQAAAQAGAEAKSQFLANMSHEIRTPMNGVLGVLQLLGREPLSAQGRKLLDEAERCGLMLAELLNDVIDFSRIEAGKLELKPEPLDPVEALASVVELLRPQAEAKSLALTLEAPAAGALVRLDPVRLRQILFNILGNAVKFTARGAVTARLRITDGDNGQRRLRFEVQDTGVGIPLHAQQGLFERFNQADGSASRNFGGSGLGLAISKSLVEIMGGGIGFTSVEAEGSTFWIEIEAPVAAAAPVSAEAPSAPLAGIKVLLVEDNATNRLVATALLESLGARIEQAADGLEGLKAAATGGFDLILMDIQMPRMDGVQAARAIRALGSPAARTPIVALTANVLAHQQAEYLKAGMDGVAAKPISAPALAAEICRVLGRAAAAAA